MVSRELTKTMYQPNFKGQLTHIIHPCLPSVYAGQCLAQGKGLNKYVLNRI